MKFASTGTNTIILFAKKHDKTQEYNNIKSYISNFINTQQDFSYNKNNNLIEKYCNYAAISKEDLLNELKEPKTKKNCIEKLTLFISNYNKKYVISTYDNKTDSGKIGKQFIGFEYSTRKGHERLHPYSDNESIIYNIARASKFYLTFILIAFYYISFLYMKPYTTLNLEGRNLGGKSIIKELLNNNFVPGVIYLKDGKNLCVSMTSKEMNAIVNDPSALTRIYEVVINGKKINCLLKEVQFNPALDLPRSFDLMEVEEGDIVKVNVPIRVLNKEICPGVKNGGDVYILTYNVNLKCEVENIPYAIEIDVKNCDMGQKFFLSDIELPKGCKMINDIILLRIAGRRVIKDATVSATEEAAATDTATASTAPAATETATK